jgi:hypothetical protein
MGTGAIFAGIGTGVAYASPGYVFMDRLGKFGVPFLAFLFLCGLISQFLKQKSLRSVKAAEDASNTSSTTE